MLLMETENCARKLLYPVAIRCLSTVVYLNFIKHRNQNLCFIKHRRYTLKFLKIQHIFSNKTFCCNISIYKMIFWSLFQSSADLYLIEFKP